METCTTIVGQYPDLTPILCGENGIRIGEVVRCKEHWAKVRGRSERSKKTTTKRHYTEYLNRN